MLGQLYTSSSSSDVSTALFVIGALNLVLVVVFLIMASNISQIRKAADADLLGLGMGKALYRFCQFCDMTCPFGASVCHRCGRDIGAWIMHDNMWWTRKEDGAWQFRYQGYWYPPDEGHPAPE